MAKVYKAIATVEVGAGGAANIEFTSIPGTYTDLLVKMSLRGASSGGGTSGAWDNFRAELNSTAGLSRNVYATDSTTVGSANYSIVYGFMTYAGATASTFSNNEMYISNYTSSNGKSASLDGGSENNGTPNIMALTAAFYNSVTSAVTSIKLIPAIGNFAQYSTATLYGIKKDANPI